MAFSKIKNSNLFPILILLFLSLIWGSSFILIKKGLLAYTPVQVGTLRIVFAFIVLLPIAIRNLRPTFKDNWKQLLVLGIITNLAPAILFAIAETNMNSSLAGMLNSLTPIFTIIVGVLFYKIRINFPLAIGLGLGLIGSVILSLVGSSGQLGEFNIYALYVILATILYGIAGNLIKVYVGNIKPLVLVSLTMFAVGPLSLMFLLSTDFINRTFTHPDALFSIISIFILGAVGTAFALGIFNMLVKKTNAVFASSTTYLIPITAIGWGLIDNEALFPLHFVGMGVIIFGIFLINKFK
jgi:drug/metabolite transporter (DMT)-like permease